MQAVLAWIVARQLVHFYKADAGYGHGAAAKLGTDMERFATWADISPEGLIEKASREDFSAAEMAQV